MFYCLFNLILILILVHQEAQACTSHTKPAKNYGAHNPVNDENDKSKYDGSFGAKWLGIIMVTNVAVIAKYDN